MNLLSLNCRGLGNPDAVGGLRNLIRREAPTIIFLCETKLSGRELRVIRASIADYEGYEVDSVGRSGGLAMWWRSTVTCRLRSATVHYIDMDVTCEGKAWRTTGFYGWPAIQDRHLSWQQLRLLARESATPWLCVGDFNEVLFSTEMKGGDRAQWQMNNFRDACDECGLRDLPFQGYAFTYDNGQDGDANRQSRLDRAMVTEEWVTMFPAAKLLHLVREWSDHAPIKVLLEPNTETTGVRRFRFEQIWVGAEGCEEVIKRAWDAYPHSLM